MKIEKFEDIEVWKEARCLVMEIYGLFSNNLEPGTLNRELSPTEH